MTAERAAPAAPAVAGLRLLTSLAPAPAWRWRAHDPEIGREVIVERAPDGPDRRGDAALVAAMRACVGAKRAGHGIGTATFIRPGRSMSQIGG